MKLFQLPLFLFALLVGGCSAKTYQSMRWQERPIKTDGDPEEWGEFLRYYDNDSKLFYDLGNDSDNLYLAARTNDDQTKRKIEQKGLELGVNRDGEKDFPVRLLFPYHASHGLPEGHERPHVEDGMHRPSTQDKRPEFRPDQKMDRHMPQQLLVTGFFNEVKDSVLSIGNPYGIEAKISMKDSNLCLEAKIPLNTFLKKHLTSADTLHPYRFQIVLDAVDNPGMEPLGRPNGAPMGPPPGGMRGEGGPGGSMPPPDDHFDRAPEGEMQRQMPRDQTESGKTEIQFIMKFSMQ